MRLLLDTHALLWWMEGSPELSPRARGAIADPGNEVFLSVVSLWEIAVKTSLGKLRLSRALPWLAQEARVQGIRLLPVGVEHCEAVAQLVFHHRDPFDRMLVAQAQVEGLDLLSRDASLDPYPPNRIW